MNGSSLRNMTHAMTGVGVVQASWVLSESGIQITEVEDRHHICVLIKLDADAFDSYLFKDAEKTVEERVIGVDMKHLNRVLKALTPGMRVTMSLCDDQSGSGVQYLEVKRGMGEKERSEIVHKLNLLELDVDRITIREKECYCTVELSSASLARIVKEFYMLAPAESACLTVSHDGAFTLAIETLSGTANVCVEGVWQGDGGLLESKQKKVDGCFDVKDLYFISRYAASLDDKVRICFRPPLKHFDRHMEPLILRYNVSVLGRALFIVIASMKK